MNGQRSTAVLIINSHAGQKAGITTNHATPDEAQAVLQSTGFTVKVRTTEYAGHATALASEAVHEGVQLVVAAGGDGTVREVACGLIGSETTLGILPMGSMMNIARSLNIPRDLRGAATVVATGNVLRMDVGRVTTRTNSDYFLEAAGIGIDAGIVNFANRIDSGDWSALVPLIRYAMHYVPHTIRLRVDQQPLVVRAHMITIAIAPFAGMAMAVAPQADVDDGLFDVVIRSGFTGLGLLRHAIAIIGRRPAPDPNIRTLRARSVKVGASRYRLQVHADANGMGSTPAHFEIIRGGLRVLARKDTPQPDRLG